MNSRKLILALVLFSVGCSPRPATDSSPNGSTEPGQEIPNELEELSPTSPNVVYATKWSEVIINANSARTAVDVGAHFATSRNKCGREAFGAIDLQTWNTFTKNANTVSESNMALVEHCYPFPDTYPYMDGSVEMKVFQSTEKKTLFESKDGQICTKIADSAVSKELLDMVQKLIITADLEDCPHGWGS